MPEFEEKTWVIEKKPLGPPADPKKATPLGKGLNDLEERIADAVNPLSSDVAVIKEAPLSVQYPEYGAVGDNSADDTAAFEKVDAVLATAQRGELLMPPGAYKLSKSGVLNLDHPGQSIGGAGQSATILKPTSAVTGPLITQATMPASDKPSGSLHGFQVDGEAAGNGAVGLSLGDLVGSSYRDLAIRNFTKSAQKAVEARNGAYWTEETVWDNITFDNNKVCLELSHAEGASNSFGYNAFYRIRLNVFAGQTGIRLVGDVKLYNSPHLGITGNLHGAGCIGIDVADTAQIWGLWAVAMETMDAGPVALRVAKEAILRGTGYLNVGVGNGVIENAGTGNIRITETGNPSINVASAATISVGYLAPRFAAVTGTTTITKITPTFAGHVVTFRFVEGLTIKNGSNLILGADFVGGANSTLTLVTDGTNWYPA